MNQYDNTILSSATNYGVPLAVAKMIVAQARLESGNYSSNVFKTDNNLFGYKYVGQSLATQGLLSPEGNYYAHYSNIADSVQELVQWLIRRQNNGVFVIGNLVTPALYASALKKADYYGESAAAYADGLQATYDKAFGNGTVNNITDIAIIGIVLGAFAAVRYLNKRK